jgi:hypothetical protein
MLALEQFHEGMAFLLQVARPSVPAKYSAEKYFPRLTFYFLVAQISRYSVHATPS